jgi:hypothetical protein
MITLLGGSLTQMASHLLQPAKTNLPFAAMTALVACIRKSWWKAKFHVAAAVSATRKAARMKQQVGKQPNAAEDAFVATVQVA